MKFCKQRNHDLDILTFNKNNIDIKSFLEYINDYKSQEIIYFNAIA